MPYRAPTSATWSTPRFSIDTLSDGWVIWQNLGSNAFAWTTANRAIYVPVRVPQRVKVLQLAYLPSTTATGNIDIGLYDQAGARVVSSGSTAKSATAAVIIVDVTDSVIGPGLYYLALNNDTTTDTFLGATIETPPFQSARGVLVEQLASVTLPATAAWSTDDTLAIAPQLAAMLNTVVT